MHQGVAFARKADSALTKSESDAGTPTDGIRRGRDAASAVGTTTKTKTRLRDENRKARERCVASDVELLLNLLGPFLGGSFSREPRIHWDAVRRRNRICGVWARGPPF